MKIIANRSDMRQVGDAAIGVAIAGPGWVGFAKFVDGRVIATLEHCTKADAYRAIGAAVMRDQEGRRVAAKGY